MVKQVLRILNKLYKWENRYYGDNGETFYSEEVLSEKDRAILSEYGWKTNEIERFSGHDERITKLHVLKKQPLLTERRIADAFVAGVGGSYLRGRSVLSAWKCLHALPVHTYEEQSEYKCCWVCGESDKVSVINNSKFQYVMHLGNAFSDSPPYAYLNLQYLLEQPSIVPTDEDIRIFSKLLELLRTSPAEETPGKFEKRLREAKIMPAAQHIRGILHSLALVGVIPNRWIAFSKNDWTNWGEMTRFERQLRNTQGRSDLEMPWAGWCGSLKINEEKAEELFGDYLIS